MSKFYYSLLLLLSLLCSLKMSIISSASMKLALITRQSTTTHNNPLENLKYQVAASLERAQLLKKPQNKHKNDAATSMKLYPRPNFYLVKLSFGTPPQPLDFGITIANSISWFPCTQNYACTDCNSSEKSQIFKPESSSSYTPLSCESQQCEWLSPRNNCTENKLCGYTILYGIGNTTGRLVSETLTGEEGGLSVHNFTVGCSVSSDNSPEGGLLGLGRGRVSLPAQMGLTSFSYCLVSHDFDDDPTATMDLVLTTTTKGPASNGSVKYTPFVKNPNDPTDLQELYYVRVKSISVGGVLVKVPKKYLVPDPKGYGGTILDLATTLTFMVKPVFDLVFNEFQKQVGNMYNRSPKFENETNLDLCYDVGNKTSVKLPNLTFTFQGGVKMGLPLQNYFAYADEDNSILCMTIVHGGGENGKVNQGPSILLGNYHQQNYYMEFDLANNQLGIRPQNCMQASS